MDLTKFDHGVFLVNLLGIIYNPKTKMILIGKRVNDPNIAELSWVFPGGRANYDGDLEESLAGEILAKTGLNVAVDDIVSAKTYPEKREFLSIYYLCHVTGGNELAGGSITELEWIQPSQVTEYFTTSIHPKVLEYLMALVN
jgi:ADP-ribose pyrophosphatase YjhB (NUDIX family)